MLVTLILHLRPNMKASTEQSKSMENKQCNKCNKIFDSTDHHVIVKGNQYCIEHLVCSDCKEIISKTLDTSQTKVCWENNDFYCSNCKSGTREDSTSHSQQIVAETKKIKELEVTKKLESSTLLEDIDDFDFENNGNGFEIKQLADYIDKISHKFNNFPKTFKFIKGMFEEYRSIFEPLERMTK